MSFDTSLPPIKLSFSDKFEVPELNFMIEEDDLEIRDILNQLNLLRGGPNGNQLIRAQAGFIQMHILELAGAIHDQIIEMKNSGKPPHEILEFGKTNLQKIYCAQAQFESGESAFQDKVNRYNSACDGIGSKLQAVNFLVTENLKLQHSEKTPLLSDLLPDNVLGRIGQGALYFEGKKIEATMAVTTFAANVVEFTFEKIIEGLAEGCSEKYTKDDAPRRRFCNAAKELSSAIVNSSSELYNQSSLSDVVAKGYGSYLYGKDTYSTGMEAIYGIPRDISSNHMDASMSLLLLVTPVGPVLKAARVPFTLTAQGIKGGSQAATKALVNVFRSIESHTTAPISLMMSRAKEGISRACKLELFSSNREFWQKLNSSYEGLKIKDPVVGTYKNSEGRELFTFTSDDRSLVFKSYLHDTLSAKQELAATFYLQSNKIGQTRFADIVGYGQRISSGEVVAKTNLSGKTFEELFFTKHPLSDLIDAVHSAGKGWGELQLKTMNQNFATSYVNNEANSIVKSFLNDLNETRDFIANNSFLNSTIVEKSNILNHHGINARIQDFIEKPGPLAASYPTNLEHCLFDPMQKNPFGYINLADMTRTYTTQGHSMKLAAEGVQGFLDTLEICGFAVNLPPIHISLLKESFYSGYSLEAKSLLTRESTKFYEMKSLVEAIKEEAQIISEYAAEIENMSSVYTKEMVDEIRKSNIPRSKKILYHHLHQLNKQLNSIPQPSFQSLETIPIFNIEQLSNKKPVHLAHDKPLAHRYDYSGNYLEAQNSFEGLPKEFNGILSKDLTIVQYHSSQPLHHARTYQFWMPVTQGNTLTTINQVRDVVAKLYKFGGEITEVSVARVRAGEPVRFWHGRAKQQIDAAVGEIRPGGGVQYRFFDFDPSWVLQTKILPK